MKVDLPLFLTLLAAVMASALQAQDSVKFRAVVQAGQSYSHPIGHGLFFALEQEDQVGWKFQIKPSQSSSEDYTACVGSPVLHGPSTTDLLAWRFAHDASADWAEHVPVKKTFSFVMNAPDQKYECANQNAMYEAFQRSQASGTEEDYSGLPHYKPRPLVQGTAVIESVTLKPGLKGSNAEFEEVTMRVLILYPHSESTRKREPGRTR